MSFANFATGAFDRLIAQKGVTVQYYAEGEALSGAGSYLSAVVTELPAKSEFDQWSDRYTRQAAIDLYAAATVTEKGRFKIDGTAWQIVSNDGSDTVTQSWRIAIPRQDRKRRSRSVL
jgi:hypothetical protein